MSPFPPELVCPGQSLFYLPNEVRQEKAWLWAKAEVTPRGVGQRTGFPVIGVLRPVHSAVWPQRATLLLDHPPQGGSTRRSLCPPPGRSHSE